jgi:Zn-finger protein
MIIFGLLAVLFIVSRWVAQPPSFNRYGHYRGDALEEISSIATNYAALNSCADCHEDEWKQKSEGPHSKMSCQSCHGPGQAHVTDPSEANIVLPAADKFCVRCHSKNNSRPRNFPQIVVKEHTEGKKCTVCHLTHNPSEMK